MNFYRKKQKMKRKNRKKGKIRYDDDPILTTVCESVVEGENIEQICRDMMYVLTNSKTGVGIAANQVGYAKRIIVIGLPYYQILTNPTIEAFAGHKIKIGESCLSYPGKYKMIERHDEIAVSCDEWEGTRIYYDFPARIVQHELDHLNGFCKVKG